MAPEDNAAAAESAGRTMQVRLRTRVAEYAVPDTAIAVPVTLTRHGLSEIVNHLLQLETPVPFEFLVPSQEPDAQPSLLRSSLGRHVEQAKLGDEKTLDLEYVPAMTAPSSQPGPDTQDWVRALACYATDSVSVYATGGYDGAVRVWDAATSRVAVDVASAHADAFVAAVAFVAPANDRLMLLSGGSDCRVCAHQVSLADGTCRLSYTASDAAAMIESLAVSPNNQMMAAGAQDGTLLLYRVMDDDLAGDAARGGDADGGDENGGEDDAAADVGGKRKRRSAGARKRGRTGREAAVKQALNCIDAHPRYGVAALTWPTPDTVWTGGQDKQVRRYDVESGVCVNTMSGAHAVTSLASSLAQPDMLASAHPDGAVRVWDTRQAAEKLVRSSLRAHTGWVSSVAWHPNEANTLVSASYDRTVRVWDLRSKVPLSTLKVHDGKVFALAWLDAQTLVSGGEDGRVVLHDIPARVAS